MFQLEILNSFLGFKLHSICQIESKRYEEKEIVKMNLNLIWKISKIESSIYLSTGRDRIASFSSEEGERETLYDVVLCVCAVRLQHTLLCV